MLGFGGAIGAGLFVGSGSAVAAAGPGVIVCFALAGVLTWQVMTMLGEMSAALPSSGAFSVHAQAALGPWAGFLAGWLYWSQLVVILAIEATGAAAIFHGWFPSVAVWVWVLVFMTTLTAVNLAVVGTFGEFEFWFALLKVGAIVAFIALAALALLGALPGTHSPGLRHLGGDGGFFPRGASGVVSGLLAVIFSFGGVECVTIAAAESTDPVRGIRSAMRSVIWRLLVCYLGSMTAIVLFLPWNDTEVGKSPFVAVLGRIGVPRAAEVMNVVVVCALLSALNAGLYSSSRMIHSLAARGSAPAALLKLSGRGVPRRAVLASVAFGFLSVALNVWWPTTVFSWMLNAVASTSLVVWALVALSHLRLRTRPAGEGPYGLPAGSRGRVLFSLATLGGLAAVLVLLALDDTSRPQVLGTAALTAVLLAVGLTRDMRTEQAGERGRARRAGTH